MRDWRERFWEKVDKSGECWTWTSARLPLGYGVFKQRVDGVWKQRKAHRIAYEEIRGPIPEGLCLDHLCRNPPCVNPAHLEPVTMAENLERGLLPWGSCAPRQYCKQNHPLFGDNLYIEKRKDCKSGSRKCRTCLSQRNAVWRTRNAKSLKDYVRAWRIRNPEKVAEYNRRKTERRRVINTAKRVTAA